MFRHLMILLAKFAFLILFLVYLSDGYTLKVGRWFDLDDLMELFNVAL